MTVLVNDYLPCLSWMNDHAFLLHMNITIQSHDFKVQENSTSLTLHNISNAAMHRSKVLN